MSWISGAENAPGLHDPRWHLRNFLIGVVVGVPFSLLVTAVAVARLHSGTP